MITMDITARGTRVLVANIVVNAPSGHSAEIVPHPNPESVPRFTPTINPMHSTAKTTAATMVRILLAFMIRPPPYSSESSGRTTMARSVAPETLEPAFSDTHTLSHAPQPLHLSSITVGRGFAPSVESSMAS